MNVNDEDSIDINKKRIRRALIKKRLELSDKERKKLDRSILMNLSGTDEYLNSSIILTYVSYNGEVDTKELIKKAIAEGKHVGCPVCTVKEGEPAIDFFYIDSMDALIEGYKGIPEPDKNTAVAVDAGDIEKALIIVPLLGYDSKRNRLGYGKGFYDRFLSSYKFACSIGLAYSLQECKALPYAEYDVRPDIIITEKRIHHDMETEAS